MQVRNLRGRYYQKPTADETEYSPIVFERLKKIQAYDDLMQQGTEERSVLAALEVTRSTLYRWKKRYREEGLAGLEDASKRPRKIREKQWSHEIILRVQKLRLENKTWGKYKLAVVYKRTYRTAISVSTLGRIISYLLKKGAIQSVAEVCGEREAKPRIFNGHAQRKTADMKPTKPGEFVQFDHMSPRVPSGRQIKHFKATCPITKISVEHVYSNATSNNGAHFLAYAQTKFPFKLLSIQVDGGGEFMSEFEAACEKDGIGLFVLPPRSPELNGCIERSNRTAKNEFYSQYDGPSDLSSVQCALEDYGLIYNTIRPHQALQYRTPMEYYSEITQKEALQSHMY
jgi:putative transposase